MAKLERQVVNNYSFKIIILLVFMLISGCLTDTNYQALPISRPLQLHELGAKTELMFKVTKEDNYAYQLEFHYEGKSNRNVRNVLEDYQGNKNGAPVNISLDIFMIQDGVEQLSSMYGAEYLPLTSWGETLNKQINREYLFPGYYRAVITTTKAMPIYQNIAVDFSVGLARKY